MKGLVDSDGSLSEPLDGFISFADCASVMSDEQTSTKRFLHMPALSSVEGTSRDFVRRSQLSCYFYARRQGQALWFRK